MSPTIIDLLPGAIVIRSRESITLMLTKKFFTSHPGRPVEIADAIDALPGYHVESVSQSTGHSAICMKAEACKSDQTIQKDLCGVLGAGVQDSRLIS